MPDLATVAREMGVLAGPGAAWMLMRLADGPATVAEMVATLAPLDRSRLVTRLTTMRGLGLVANRDGGPYEITGRGRLYADLLNDLADDPAIWSPQPERII